MTIITPFDKTGATEEVTSEAYQLYALATEVLTQIIGELQATGEAKSAKEISVYTKEHREALRLVMTERANVEKLRKLESGIAYDYALDFDAARDEIGRRLARLRDAGTGG
jgi:hypothetical protein